MTQNVERSRNQETSWTWQPMCGAKGNLTLSHERSLPSSSCRVPEQLIYHMMNS
jgi:hypothetical protein